MKEPVVLSTGTSTIVVVKPSHESYDHRIVESALEYKWDGHVKAGRYVIPLPAGQYSILGWSDELSEKQLWEIGIPGPLHWRSFRSANNIERELLLIKK